MTKHFFSLGLILGVSFSSFAGGFQVNTQGLKATGMGGSFTGFAPDASVSFFNPAALSQLEKNYINAGVNVVLPRSSFLGASGKVEEMSNQLNIPFSLYGSYKFNAKNTFGISINTPFGLSTKWDENWSGRYITQVTSLNTIFIQPTWGYKLSEKVSIGAGPVIAFGTARIEKALPYASESGADAQAELKGSGTGFGFNAGIYTTLGKLSVGADYRSPVKIGVSNGTATFTAVPGSVLSGGIIPPSADFKTDVNLPGVASIGASYKMNLKMSFTLDVNYTFWSSYKELKFEFADYPALNSVNPKNYTDVVSIRAGIQSAVSSKLTIRGGIAVDQSPVPAHYLSPELPDNNKLVLSAGASYQVTPNILLEAAFMYENVKERRESDNHDTNFNGTYKSLIYIAGVGAQFTF